MIFPIVLLVFIWLWTHLTKKSERQVILKALCWVLATIILIADVVLLLMAVYRPVFPGGSNVTLGGLTVTILVLTSPLYISALLSFFVIRPRMRDIYPTSNFLYNFPKQVLLYLTAVLLYLLAAGIVEAILGLQPL